MKPHVNDDYQHLRSWLRAPNSGLGYEKPIDLVASGEYRQVTDLLLAIADGVTA